MFTIIFFVSFYSPRGLGPMRAESVRVVRIYGRPSEDKVKVIVQGTISRPINGSKLLFHLRMYLYETSRNIQTSWPIFQGPLWTLARLWRSRFLSQVESQDLLMVASCCFTWGCISIRPAGIYKPLDLYFRVHFGLWPDYEGQDFCPR